MLDRSCEDYETVKMIFGKRERQGEAYEYGAMISWNIFGYACIVAASSTLFFVVLAGWQISLGLYESGGSLWILSREAHKIHDAQRENHAAVVMVLRGLELLLLSPLPFLLFTWLSSFVAEWTKEKMEPSTQAKLHSMKLLLYGSFMGLLCLDFIGKEVSETIELESGAIEVAGILVLGLFILGLEMSHRSDQHHLMSSADPDRSTEDTAIGLPNALESGKNLRHGSVQVGEGDSKKEVEKLS